MRERDEAVDREAARGERGLETDEDGARPRMAPRRAEGAAAVMGVEEGRMGSTTDWRWRYMPS